MAFLEMLGQVVSSRKDLVAMLATRRPFQAEFWVRKVFEDSAILEAVGDGVVKGNRSVGQGLIEVGARAICDMQTNCSGRREASLAVSTCVSIDAVSGLIPIIPGGGMFSFSMLLKGLF